MSKILDKIKKLYEKAESAKEIGNLEEANSFLKGVKRLLEKHQLEMSDINNHSIKDEQKLTHVHCRDIKYGEIISDGDWDISLMGTICRGHFCNMFINFEAYKGKNYSAETGYFTIVGTEENIEICKYLYSLTYHLFKKLSSKKFNELRAQAKRDSAIVVNPKVQTDWDIQYAMKQHLDEEKFWDLYGPSDINKSMKFDIKNIKVKQSKKTGRYIAVIKNPEKARMISYRKIWIRSYLSGAVLGLQSKFDEREQKLKEQSEKTNSLIVANAALVREYMDDNFNLGSHKSKRSGHDSSAYSKGISDGKGAHLASGVSANNGKVQITKLIG